MARIYDIAQRIANANQKPTVIIDEEHEYKINIGKSTAIMIQALAEENEGKDSLEFLDKVVILGLGKDAHEYIESLELTMPAYSEIVMVVMAAFQDVELEELEKQQKEKKQATGTTSLTTGI